MSSVARHRRKLDFQSWPDVLADVDALSRAPYDRAGNWDLSQVLEHVGDGLRTAIHGKEQQGPWIVRKILGPIILKRILSQRRMKAGIKVPDWWLPGPGQDETAAVERFRAEVAEFQALGTPPKPHPFFGPMTKQQWNDLALVHAGHHLSFLVPRA